ncbi:class I poly(R)-hydroxyalkanoic acid synthase [Altererythrobacter sp. TH136]|uniref:PHA/PHB synthase family protein n=1 Tax=Altererythrobacter sp. TH136 TaxID=2067415 RepID=UPI001162DBD3|nr:class I poly(R)-hydroxyalkanoic acid synthase [Altererythrobacter sp. TH136]QDM41517.1 class I poly(R)-hydroxyalkanoic acid synthase [Altererythrobacter sp. TH136]
MADDDRSPDPFTALWNSQGDAMRQVWGGLMPGGTPQVMTDWAEIGAWSDTARKLQAMWLEFVSAKASAAGDPAHAFDPMQFMVMSQGWQAAAQQGLAATQSMAEEGMKLWQTVAAGAMSAGAAEPELPRADKRFADPAWRNHPAFALLHQTYLMVAETMTKAAEQAPGIDAEKKEQLTFATKALVEAMSPDNFLATNPVVLQRTIESKGENLVKGMRHLIQDLERGQLTHTDPDAFKLGENIAVTPGKVVHEGSLYQLIQYSPSTDQVLETPLVIFPPWINRFYILDLTPKKSFIKWAVDQGLSVFIVSWKSADASMKDVVWDDYIRAQMEAIDIVRERLAVPAIHAIGYCVSGTTLAAVLAIQARRGEAGKVASATFFTAQVDFEKAGELKHFIDDGQLEMIGNIAKDGYLDGRYMAATFNLLRGRDLIWNYVVNNYLLGEDYPAFDLLHWNGDVTNLPAKWHGDYLRDLYRGNKLVVPDALEADGTPIDLTRIETPIYIQAGREDHIAPAESVWRMTRHVRGDTTFVLAGSGHIAGVVNHPDAGKYQYWTGDSAAASLDDFVAGATEHKGSWWPHWRAWIENRGGTMVPAEGKRVPGAAGDTVVEDAPGRYVMTR